MPTRITAPGATHRAYSFGEFTLDVDRGALLRAGRDVKLRPKSFEVLRYLVERQGLLVSRDELLDSIWGRTIVTEEAVTQCLRDIRKALGDRSQKIIRTVPRRGYIFELAVTEGDSLVAEGKAAADGKATPRRPRWPFAAAVALLLGVTVGWWAFQDRGVEAPAPVADKPYTIAVLPFLDMSPGRDQGYFADGISEQILNLLASIPDLRVIARTSSFSFRDKKVDIRTIAEQLGATHVLEGSVRRSGGQVRITAQLIDASDSTNVWSWVYDRELTATNLFQIQSEIGRAVTSQLKMALTEDQEQRLANIPTDNMEAYVAYLLGRDRLRGRKVAELADAVEQFSLAIELDPQFAAAYAGLADACGLYDSYSGGQRNEHCPSSRAGREQLARKALELDPSSAEAWISLGTSVLELGMHMHRTDSQPRVHEKLNEALAAFERGLELNPTLSEVYHGYGYNLMHIILYPDGMDGWIKAWKAGRWESVFDRGLEVDPLSIRLHQDKSWYPITVSSKEEAKWHARRMIEIAPDSPLGYTIVAKQEWELNGRIDESIRWESKALAIDPQDPEFPTNIGLAYSVLGDADMALAYFDLATALTAPDNVPAQEKLLLEQAIVRLMSGKIDAHQAAELPIPLNTPPTTYEAIPYVGMRLGVFVDLATGQPADALARMEVFSPDCIGAIEDKFGWPCPDELVRAYQELGDHEAAQALSDANVRNWQLTVDEYPVPWKQLGYAGALATAGQTDAALDVLENLVSSGWRGDNYNKHLGFVLCCSIRFDAIRDHERFRAIAATIKADMAQQLENVREMQRRGEVPTLEAVNAMIESVYD